MYKCKVKNPWGEAETKDFSLKINVLNEPPTITIQPQNTSVTIGETALFDILAAGVGLEYQWYKNGDLVNGAEKSIFVIQKVSKEDDSSKITCIVKNPAGSDTSDEVTLFVVETVEAPQITKQPEDCEVNAGDSAVFSVQVTGTNLEYKWKKNGIRLSNNEGPIYVIQNVAIADNSSKISCTISNTAGTIISREAVLTVKNVEPPIIVSDPLDQQVQAGKSATFSVVATGNNLTYLWKRDQQAIPGATTSSYTINNCTKQDNGATFHCIVANSGGIATSKGAKLTVSENAVKPTITKDPENKTATAGEDATFTVAATGSNLEYQWERDKAKISGATETSYTLKGVANSDNGATFRCIVSNKEGSETSKEAILTIVEKEIAPEITEHPKDQTAVKGKPATFSVNAKGTNLQFQWQKNNSDIPTATTNTYSISSVEEADHEAVFKCKVTNKVGNTESKTATLTVHWPPKIDEHPKNQEVESGNNANFSISMSNEGNPKCTYKWSNGSTEKNLSFSASKTDNEKEYYCEATNKAGTVKSNSAKLSVLWKPEINDGPANKKVTVGNSVSFSITMSDEGNPKCSYEWRGGQSSNSKTLQFSASKSDHDKGFYCIAKNKVGEVKSSEAKLEVLWKPEIGSNPKSVNAKAGNNASFSISMADKGNPSCSYTWYADNQPVQSSNSQSISIPTKKQYDGYRFYCKAENSVGEDNSGSATLTLWWLQNLQLTGPSSVTEGQTGTFRVQSIDAKPSNSVTYSWSGGGSGTSTTIRFNNPGNTSVSCTARLNGASLSRSINVSVKEKPNTAPKITNTTTATKTCNNDQSVQIYLGSDITASDNENDRLTLYGRPDNSNECQVSGNGSGTLTVRETGCTARSFWVLIKVYDGKLYSDEKGYQIHFNPSLQSPKAKDLNGK